MKISYWVCFLTLWTFQYCLISTAIILYHGKYLFMILPYQTSFPCFRMHYVIEFGKSVLITPNQQTLCIETNPDIFIIRNPDIFIIRGIFETLKYSKCLSKIFPGYNYFLWNAPYRRSRSQMFFKICVLKYFAIFTGKTCVEVPFQ